MNNPVSKPRVLLIEDETLSLVQLALPLIQSNFRVVTYSAAKPALEFLEKAEQQKHIRFDLAIIDLSLPDMDLLELTRQMRALLPASYSIPIIAVVNENYKGQLPMDNWIIDGITKPITSDKLYQSLLKIDMRHASQLSSLLDRNKGHREKT